MAGDDEDAALRADDLLGGVCDQFVTTGLP
jgi:hypothetical protein